MIEFVARMYAEKSGEEGRFDIDPTNPKDATVPEFIN